MLVSEKYISNGCKKGLKIKYRNENDGKGFKSANLHSCKDSYLDYRWINVAQN